MSPTTKHRLILGAQALLIAGLGWLLYARVLHGPFLFDDIYYIVRNPAVKHLERLDTVFISNISSLRFIPFLSFAVNYHLHQLHVVGYHLVNVVIHITNAMLVWWLFRLTLRSPKIEKEALPIDAEILAYLVALLFLVHPLQTQAVSYISQRFASLATLFYLASLCAFAAFKTKKRGVYIVLCVISAIAAIFSKQIALTLPLMILIYDRTFFPSARKHLVVVVLLAGALFLIIPAYYSFNVMNFLTIERPSDSHPGDTLTAGTYFLTQLRVLIIYLKLTVFPTAQNFLYDFSVSKSLFEIKTFLAALVFLALAGYTFYALKKDKLVGFGLLWFFVAVSVESSFIVIGHVIFEHRMYLPSIGIILAASVLLARWVRSPRWTIGILGGIIVIFSLLTLQRNRIYADSVTFWQDNLNKSPKLVRPHLNLGVAYMEKGQFPQALEQFEAAAALDPAYEEARGNKGLVLMKMGRYEEAMVELNAALVLYEHYVDAYHNRGLLYAKLKQPQAAMADLNKALEINPSHAESHAERAGILFSLGKPEDALEGYARALLYDPGNVKALNNRGVVYNALGEYDIAVRDLKEAIKLDPSFGAAHYNLSYTQYKRGKLDEARACLQMAISLGYPIDQKFADKLQRSSP